MRLAGTCKDLRTRFQLSTASTLVNSNPPRKPQLAPATGGHGSTSPYKDAGFIADSEDRKAFIRAADAIWTKCVSDYPSLAAYEWAVYPLAEHFLVEPSTMVSEHDQSGRNSSDPGTGKPRRVGNC